MNRGNIKGGFGSAKMSFGDISPAKSEERAERRSTSTEEKVAKSLIKGLDSLTFEASKFTIPIAHAPLAIRQRFLTLVVHLVNVWAIKYDNALWEDEEEMDFLVDAKRIQESLSPFYK